MILHRRVPAATGESMFPSVPPDVTSRRMGSSRRQGLSMAAARWKVSGVNAPAGGLLQHIRPLLPQWERPICKKKCASLLGGLDDLGWEKSAGPHCCPFSSPCRWEITRTNKWKWFAHTALLAWHRSGRAAQKAAC